MAAIGKQVAVDSSAAVSVAKDRLTILKNKGTSSAYLGGGGVTSGTGYELAAGDVITVDSTQDEVFAVCTATQTTTLDVLAVRKAF